MAAKKKEVKPEFNFEKELIVLGHLVKYNLYLLSKTILASSLISKGLSPEDAVAQTNELITELDLDTKSRLNQQ